MGMNMGGGGEIGMEMIMFKTNQELLFEYKTKRNDRIF